MNTWLCHRHWDTSGSEGHGILFSFKEIKKERERERHKIDRMQSDLSSGIYRELEEQQ